MERDFDAAVGVGIVPAHRRGPRHQQAAMQGLAAIPVIEPEAVRPQVREGLGILDQQPVRLRVGLEPR